MPNGKMQFLPLLLKILVLVGVKNTGICFYQREDRNKLITKIPKRKKKMGEIFFHQKRGDPIPEYL
jgi:hypothetical protein